MITIDRKIANRMMMMMMMMMVATRLMRRPTLPTIRISFGFSIGSGKSNL